ncbi:MAG: molecular chaperone DnaJ [Desulfatitalea sp. BRH_c12]|nr:MAG: molecular chaperone DnaJ [Desulfatitalea sp. BRH_c12]
MSPFVDYYEDLQVSPKADFETIERVFRLLAKRYHPDNPNTGDITRFNIITRAYHELSDPQKRAAYDVAFDRIQASRWKDNPESTGGFDVKDPKQIRQAILTVLLQQRLQEPSAPEIGLWYLEKLLGWPEKILEFHIWYMKEKGWIRSSDSGQYMISADGVDKLEENWDKEPPARLQLPLPN